MLTRVAALAHRQHVWESGADEEQLAHPVRSVHEQSPAFTGALKAPEAGNTVRRHIAADPGWKYATDF